MERSQPQYLIQANSRCKTHPPGMKIVYTGPRGNISPGWKVISGPHRPVYNDSLPLV
jgi:hypothetical protein